MTVVIKLVVSVVVGCLLGWVLLVGFCSLPGIRYSNACGHNAPILLLLFIPVGVTVSWLLASRIARAIRMPGS